MAFLGLVLLLASIGFLALEGLQDEGRPPEPVVQVLQVQPQTGGWLVRVQVSNRSRATATALRVEGQLRRGAEVVERSETELAYLPGRSSREAGLFFRNDPGALQLVVAPRSYEAP